MRVMVRDDNEGMLFYENSRSLRWIVKWALGEGGVSVAELDGADSLCQGQETIYNFLRVHDPKSIRSLRFNPRGSVGS